jgi:hypothetical protein
MIESFFQKIMFTIVALTIIMTGVIVIWLDYPYRTIVISQVPIPVFKEEILSGGAVVLNFKYCNYTSTEVHVFRKLVSDSISIDLPEVDRVVPKGCFDQNAPVAIPKLLNKGIYHLEYRDEWQLNPVRKENLQFVTDNFLIQ